MPLPLSSPPTATGLELCELLLPCKQSYPDVLSCPQPCRDWCSSGNMRPYAWRVMTGASVTGGAAAACLACLKHSGVSPNHIEAPRPLSLPLPVHLQVHLCQ